MFIFHVAQDGIPQDEADAVAALLAAASGEAGEDGAGLPRGAGAPHRLLICARKIIALEQLSSLLPSQMLQPCPDLLLYSMRIGDPRQCADRVEPQLAVAAASSAVWLGRAGEREYLVKWVGRSHMHNEWVQEALLARIAKRKLVNFQRRHVAADQAPCVLMEEAWRLPERFVARRPNPVSPGWQVLVKWNGLPYDCASWEVRRQCRVNMKAQSLPMWKTEGTMMFEDMLRSWSGQFQNAG